MPGMSNPHTQKPDLLGLTQASPHSLRADPPQIDRSLKVVRLRILSCADSWNADWPSDALPRFDARHALMWMCMALPQVSDTSKIVCFGRDGSYQPVVSGIEAFSHS